MVRIDLLTQEREEEYEKFLLSDERVLFNSSLKFRDLLRKVTNAEDYYLTALHEDRIVGAFPSFLLRNERYGNILNSLPWYGSNPGITVDPQYPERQRLKRDLLNAFHELAMEKNALTSTVITRPFEPDVKLYEECSRHSYLDSRIGLVTPLPAFSTDIEANIMAIIHSKTRNLLRKAQKSGITFYHDNSESTIRFLVETHTRNMEEAGAPPKGPNLFNEVVRLFTYDRDYRIYVAELDGVRIAALLLKYFAMTVDYFTPAIVAEYRSHQPLNLLIFNAMKDAAQRGFRYWNWGGTTLPSQEGVYHFKKRWGSEECRYYYYVRAYRDMSPILSLDAGTLTREYPFFYVIPFSELHRSERSGEP
jgi:hypothetical protein